MNAEKILSVTLRRVYTEPFRFAQDKLSRSERYQPYDGREWATRTDCFGQENFSNTTSIKEFCHES